MSEMFSLDNLCIAVVGDMLVNFGDILPEISKGSACWDLGGNSHLKYPSV